MPDEIPGGGLANFGQVVRRGDVVERPAPPHAVALHRYLRGLRDAGFDGVPEPKELRGADRGAHVDTEVADRSEGRATGVVGGVGRRQRANRRANRRSRPR